MANESSFYGTAISTRGTPLVGQSVAICSQPANTSTTPCSPLVTTYTDITGSTPTGTPGITTTDSFGNFHFYLPSGIYTVQIYGPQVASPVVQKDTFVPVGTTSDNVFTGTNTFNGPVNISSLTPTGKPYFDVTASTFGATGNTVEFGNQFTGVGTCGMTSGQAILTCTGAAFTAADVGKIINVYNAGNAQTVQNNKQPLVTTIASFQSATQVTLTASAQQTVSNVSIYYGTDDRAAIQSAIAAANTVGGGNVFFPKGKYLIGSYVLQAGVRFYGLNFFSSINLIGVGGGCNSDIIALASAPDNFRLISSNSSDGLSVVTDTLIQGLCHDNKAAWQPSLNAPSTSSSSSTVGMSCVFCQNHWEIDVIGRDSKASGNIVISAISGNGTTATVTTSTAHNYANGQFVSISGVTGLTGFNTSAVQIANVPDNTHFTYLNATSGTGTVSGSTTALAVTSGGASDSEGVNTDFFNSAFGYYYGCRGEANTAQSGNPFSATNSTDIFYTNNLAIGSSFWQCFSDHGSRNLHFSHNHAYGAFQRDFSLESSTNVTYDGDISGDQTVNAISGSFPANTVLGTPSPNGFLANNAVNVQYNAVTSGKHSQCGIALQSSTPVVIANSVLINNTNNPICLSGTTDNVRIIGNQYTGNGTNAISNSASGTHIQSLLNTPDTTSGAPTNNITGGLLLTVPCSGANNCLELTDGSGNNAFIGIRSGSLGIVNSAFSTQLFTLDNGGNFTAIGNVSGGAYRTASNCAVNSVSPAACGSAASGAFVVPTTTTTYTVNTTAITANSVVIITPRTYIGNLPSAPTCVVPAITAEPVVSAISAGTSFTIALASTTGQTCWNYWITN